MDGSTDDGSWPVSWAPAVALTRSTGGHPDDLLHDGRLAAHRVLDRLAAIATDVRAERPGARTTMARSLAEVITTLPWLTPSERHHAHGSETDCAGCDYEQVDSADGYPTGPSLIDDAGISGLACLAGTVSGEPAATAVRRLGEAARAAEKYVTGLFPVAVDDLSGDLALLAGATADLTQPPTNAPASERNSFDGGFWTHIATTAPLAAVSPCPAWLSSLGYDDLERNPQPTGTATNTTGITRVDVPDPCGPVPRMTIHGQGFGAHRPTNVDVVVATWDTTASNLVYRNAQNVSWTDDTIVVDLPSNVVPGYAAFADLNFVKTYNAWADGRNSRVNAAMHAHGCPGVWTVEEHLPLVPDANPAAAYRAGAPILIGQLNPSVGPVSMWDADTVHLRTGDAFQIGWRVYGADTLTLKPVDQYDDSGAILTAAGYPATGVVLRPQDAYLTFTAPSTLSEASFLLEADNGCGTVLAHMSILVSHPPLAPATTTIFQALAVGGDVTVTPGSGGETLDPPTGNLIPLVAGKRTVVRVDWWPATEQVASDYRYFAQASARVTGDLLPRGGVTIPAFVSTADAAPPADPVTHAAGPGFDSLADYQQWVDKGISTNPFFFVLPPELCLGGTILGTPHQALTVIDVTITLSILDGPSATIDAGIEVTFHPRRKVGLRYLPYVVSDPTLAPTDDQCEAALKTAGTLMPFPDPDIYRLPGPVVTTADGHLVEDLEAQRAAVLGPFSDTWRDEIWVLMGTPNQGSVSLGEFVVVANTDPVVCTHEMGHEYHQNHLNVCGNVPGSDLMSTWPDDGYVPIDGWDTWGNADVPPGRLDMMAYTYCQGAGWIHPERWRRIFLQVGPPK